jgi:hypothetical protein
MRQQFCMLSLAVIVSVIGCTKESLSWQRYADQDFPARLRSLTTPLGSVLDANRVLRYRSWTVSFGKGIPYAFHKCTQSEECEIIISNLMCDHPSDGHVPCQLKLHNKANPSCELIVPERETFQIGCPHDVALERDVIIPRGKR